jgi:uncharacterized protein YegP (UPF0339 family)
MDMNTPKWITHKQGLYWRFRLEASNGKVLLDSGNSYRSKKDAQAAISTVTYLIKAGPIHKEIIE